MKVVILTVILVVVASIFIKSCGDFAQERQDNFWNEGSSHD